MPLKNDMTDNTAQVYAPGHGNQETKRLYMFGKVGTQEKCPVCKKAFKNVRDVDIFCPDCGTKPEYYFVFMNWEGKVNRIWRDREGHKLDSYRRALRLLERMRTDIDEGVFNIKHYLPVKIGDWYCKNKFLAWLETKESLAPSTYPEYKRHTERYFIPFFGDKDVRSINRGTIDDFLLWLPKAQAEYIKETEDRKTSRFRVEKLSKKTQKNMLIELRNFFWMAF